MPTRFFLDIKADRKWEGVSDKTERGYKGQQQKVGNFLQISLGLQKKFPNNLT